MQIDNPRYRREDEEAQDSEPQGLGLSALPGVPGVRGVVRQKKEPRYIMVEVVEVKDDGDVVVQHKSTALNMLGNGGLQTVSRADIKEKR